MDVRVPTHYISFLLPPSLFLKSMRQLALLIAAGLFPFPLYASSFAYEDLASYPRYRVVLTENRIAESDILDNFDKVKKRSIGERVYKLIWVQQTTAWKQQCLIDTAAVFKCQPWHEQKERTQRGHDECPWAAFRVYDSRRR